MQTDRESVPNTEHTELQRISHEVVFSAFVLGNVMGTQTEEKGNLFFTSFSTSKSQFKWILNQVIRVTNYTFNLQFDFDVIAIKFFFYKLL